MSLVALTNSTRKAVRTIVQVVAASVPTLGIIAAGLPAKYSAIVLGVLVPVAVKAHNLMEDKGIIGTWLRRPTPDGPGTPGA